MAKNRLVKFMVNEEQFNRIKSNASQRGFCTVSAYLRELSLNHDFKQSSMLLQIYNKVVENGTKVS